MNELRTFTLKARRRRYSGPEDTNIRATTINGEPWFVGKDIAEALGYERPDNAIRNHVDDEDKLMHQISALGQNRQMYIINESGLYSLIFSSKLDSAKRFKHWVTSVVLPELRKTGTYSMPGADVATLDEAERLNPIDPEYIIRASEVLLKSNNENRPYILNALKNIIPNVADVEIPVSVETETAKDEPQTVETEEHYVFSSRKFKNYMKRNNISVGALSEMSGVSPQTISGYRTGRRAPTAHTLELILTSLNVDPKQFERGGA